jgi:hypothetical protein
LISELPPAAADVRARGRPPLSGKADASPPGSYPQPEPIAVTTSQTQDRDDASVLHACVDMPEVVMLVFRKKRSHFF